MALVSCESFIACGPLTVYIELLNLQDSCYTYQPNSLSKQWLLLGGEKTAEYRINVALAVCTESVCCVISA